MWSLTIENQLVDHLKLAHTVTVKLTQWQISFPVACRHQRITSLVDSLPHALSSPSPAQTRLWLSSGPITHNHNLFVTCGRPSPDRNILLISCRAELLFPRSIHQCNILCKALALPSHATIVEAFLARHYPFMSCSKWTCLGARLSGRIIRRRKMEHVKNSP